MCLFSERGTRIYIYAYRAGKSNSVFRTRDDPSWQILSSGTNVVVGEEEEDMADELRPMYETDELNELVSTN